MFHLYRDFFTITGFFSIISFCHCTSIDTLCRNTQRSEYAHESACKNVLFITLRFYLLNIIGCTPLKTKIPDHYTIVKFHFYFINSAFKVAYIVKVLTACGHLYNVFF